MRKSYKINFMSLTQIALLPTTSKDLDTILDMERSPENAHYIFQ